MCVSTTQTVESLYVDWKLLAYATSAVLKVLTVSDSSWRSESGEPGYINERLELLVSISSVDSRARRSHKCQSLIKYVKGYSLII